MHKTIDIIKTGLQCTRGLYSKRQCTNRAINIGKELVDITRNGAQLSKELVQGAIKKHAPKLKIDIIDNVDDLKRFSKFSESEADTLSSLGLNFYYGDSKNSFIYLANGSSKSNIPIIAHECEHALNGENTFFMRLIKRLPEPKKTKTQNTMENTDNLDMLLKEYLNLDSLADTNFKTLNEYLQSDNFIGLTSEKRINAYIRAISRYCVNPKNTKSAPRLFANLISFKDEMRAHKVSEAVAKYQGVENPEMFTICKELYERTYNILKRDFLVALRHLRNKKEVKTSLPSNCSKTAVNKFDDMRNRILQAKENGEFKTLDLTREDYPDLYQGLPD